MEIQARYTLLNVVDALALLLIPALFSCSPQEKKNFSEIEWAREVEKTRTEDLYAPHFEEGRFFAPWMKMADKNVLDVLGWKLFSKTDYTDKEKAVLPRVIPDTAKRLEKTRGDFILWIGHNTFLIRVDDVYWLTTPFFQNGPCCRQD